MRFYYCYLFVGIVLLFALCCGTSDTGRDLGQGDYVENNFILTPRCMGPICLGNKLMELKGRDSIKLRVDEFRYKYSSTIDSVLFSEWVIDGEVVAYTRNSIFDINDSTSIRMVVTKSKKMMIPNGIRVGMRFHELKKKYLM